MDTAKKSTTSTAETPAGQAPDALAETSADEMRASIDEVEGANPSVEGEPSKESYLQNRELSWLTFNERVLDQGADETVPLLERLNFISIFWSNLQEFFMVRVGSLTDLSLVKKHIIDSKSGMTPAEQLDAIYARCHELYPIQERTYESVRKQLCARGISCIVPGLEGYTEHVRVVSIVGRLLEHSRIYGFGPRDNMNVYLSSADLMTRNMDKRIEIAWPVLDSELREQILGYLDVSLSDTAKLRELMPDGSYTPLGAFAKEDADGETVLFESQEFFIKRAQQRRLEAAEDEAARDAARRRSAQLMAAHEMTEDEASIRAEERAAAAAAREAEAAAEAAVQASVAASSRIAPATAPAIPVGPATAPALEADAIEPPVGERPCTEQGMVAAPPATRGAKKPSLLVRFLSLFVR